MKISFVIPSFNDTRILETIESIKRNVYNLGEHSLEIVVQDCGSNDSLVSRIDSTLSVDDKLIIENDLGIFDGINRGIKNCTGELIITLGSDDRICSLDLEGLVKLFDLGYNFFQFDIEYTNENWKPLRFWKARRLNNFNLYLGRQYAHFGLITTKEIYTNLGYFNVFNKINADYEFFYNCVKQKSKIGINEYIINKVLTQMRVGGNSSAGFCAIYKGNLRLLEFILKKDFMLLPGFLILKPFFKLIEVILVRIK